MSNATTPLRQRLRDAASEAMIDAAEKIMLKKGYEGATMQDIAATAGCATGSLYSYFKNKEELLNAIVTRHLRAMFRTARAAFEQGTQPLDRVHQGLIAIHRYVFQHKSFFKMFFNAMPMRHQMLKQRFGKEAQQDDQEYQTLELQALRQAQENGQIRKDLAPEVIHELMDAVCISMFERVLMNNEQVTAEQQVALVWSFITAGISAGRAIHGQA